MCVSCSDASQQTVLSSTSSSGSGSAPSAASFYAGLKAKICPKCLSFWLILALVAVVIYVKRK